MFGDLEKDQLQCAIEAMLFVSDQPTSTTALAEALDCDDELVQTACMHLQAHLQEENAGIQLRAVAGGWQLCTHPAMHELLEHYVLSWERHTLSQAALETLSIIAYTQPVTRAGVASIRGVNSDSSISSLIEKGYVREAGVQDSPGNPVLYRTTQTFLERFGLNSLKDLPDLQAYAPDEKTRAYIEKRLSTPQSSMEFDSEIDDSEDEESDEEYQDQKPDEGPGGSENPAPLQSEETIDTSHETEDESVKSSELQQRLRKAATDAFAKASGITDKVDFDELRFDEGDDE